MTFIFTKTVSHGLLVQVAYYDYKLKIDFLQIPARYPGSILHITLETCEQHSIQIKGTERCDSPLARPVEPLVYMMTATSSGQGALWTTDANKHEKRTNSLKHTVCGCTIKYFFH